MDQSRAIFSMSAKINIDSTTNRQLHLNADFNFFYPASKDWLHSVEYDKEALYKYSLYLNGQTIHILWIRCHVQQLKPDCCLKALLNSVHLNGHTRGFSPRTRSLKPSFKALWTLPHESFPCVATYQGKSTLCRIINLTMKDRKNRSFLFNELSLWANFWPPSRLKKLV